MTIFFKKYIKKDLSRRISSKTYRREDMKLQKDYSNKEHSYKTRK